MPLGIFPALRPRPAEAAKTTILTGHSPRQLSTHATPITTTASIPQPDTPATSQQHTVHEWALLLNQKTLANIDLICLTRMTAQCAHALI
jgi:hypothetical protein